jgi:hypothetical protein
MIGVSSGHFLGGYATGAPAFIEFGHFGSSSALRTALLPGGVTKHPRITATIYFGGQFAAETITRPAKEKKSGAFTLPFLPFFVFVCPHYLGFVGQITPIEAARRRARGIGRVEIGL